MKIKIILSDGQVLNATIDDNPFKKEDEIKMGKDYYCIDINGEWFPAIWENDSIDNKRKEIGNFFLTKEEVEEEIEYRKALVRVKDYIKEHDLALENVNWYVENQRKYIVYYKHEEDKLHFDWCGENKYLSPFPYLKESNEKFLKDCEADLKIIFKIK